MSTETNDMNANVGNQVAPGMIGNPGVPRFSGMLISVVVLGVMMFGIGLLFF